MGEGDEPRSRPADGKLIGAPAIKRKKQGISWIWLVPVIALLAGLSLVVRGWLQAGPTITIVFQTADGLEAGKTKIKFKEVEVGQIETITLAEDRSHVITTAQLVKQAASLAQEGTSFWVVRPRLTLSGVSGLGTLLSGAYIGVDAPMVPVKDHPKKEFTGLEAPPEVMQDRPGKRFVLKARTLGSLDIGSPVYFRRVSVGQVVSYKLDPDGSGVDVNVFVDAPNDRYVTTGTRFWNASGVDVNVSAQGLQVRTESLLAVALGGLAFEELGEHGLPAARADARFTIFDSEQAARARPDGIALPIRLRFNQSVRGLTVGAPVDFNGIALGQVDAITMDFDDKQKRFFAVVLATIYPERLGPIARIASAEEGGSMDRPTGKLLAVLVERGLRAQLRTGNLLTGQLYVGLDVFPNAPPARFTMGDPADLPTVPADLQQLQEQLASIANKLDKVPFDKIGTDLSNSLASATRLMNRLDRQVVPQAQAALATATAALAQLGTTLSPDTGLPSNVNRVLQEMDRTMRSLRALSDYLQAHPDSLIRGRAPDPRIPQERTSAP
jgi:paraquat-inducible protein B